MKKQLIYRIPIKQHRIQDIRAIQAILESKSYEDCSFCVEKSLYKILNSLNNHFNQNYNIKTCYDDCNYIDFNIEIDHTAPSTKINDIHYSILFPKSLILNLSQSWGGRQLSSFSGLPTISRLNIINKILTGGIKKRIFITKSRINMILYKLFPKKSFKTIYRKNNIMITFINNGRLEKFKYIDSKYYNLMLSSEHIFCFDGDYIWTYRFFEAIMCGCTPVIENFHGIYEGYFFITLADYKFDKYLTAAQKAHNLNMLINKHTLK